MVRKSSEVYRGNSRPLCVTHYADMPVSVLSGYLMITTISPALAQSRDLSPYSSGLLPLYIFYWRTHGGPFQRTARKFCNRLSTGVH